MHRHDDELPISATTSFPNTMALSVATEATDLARESIEQRLKLFLERQLLVDFGADITRSSDLFREGLIDSYAYIEIMRFIEAEFGIVISDEEMLLGVEVSLMGLSDFAQKKRAQAR
jgi:acyl carrier protein